MNAQGVRQEPFEDNAICLKTHLHKDGGAVGRQLVCERLQDEVREGLLVLEPPVNTRQMSVDG